MLSDTLILYIFDIFREYKKSKISSAAGVMTRQRSSCLIVSSRRKRNYLLRRWLSGLRQAIANRQCGNSAPQVQILLSA